jgi:hypothetical protein
LRLRERRRLWCPGDLPASHSPHKKISLDIKQSEIKGGSCEMGMSVLASIVQHRPRKKMSLSFMKTLIQPLTKTETWTWIFIKVKKDLMTSAHKEVEGGGVLAESHIN